jgi:hypothetical protein
MSLSGSLEQTTLPAMLQQAARVYGTGAMHVSGDPGGVIYLSGGGVSYIETPAAPGLDVLVVRSGRVCPHDWLAARDAGKGDAAVGESLVGRGLLGRRELEVFTLSAVFDSALYVLSMTAGTYRFVPGANHWLGVVRPVGVEMLMREVVRRQAMLDRLGGPVLSQAETVTPVRRLPGGRVTVTARQWAILMDANGQRTVRDLAWSLGRGVFAVTLEIHRLMARGLVEVTGDGAGAGEPTPAADPIPLAQRSGLPRRRPGGSWPGPASQVGARSTAEAESFGQADIYTLKRLVDRLEALA